MSCILKSYFWLKIQLVCVCLPDNTSSTALALTSSRHVFIHTLDGVTDNSWFIRWRGSCMKCYQVCQIHWLLYFWKRWLPSASESYLLRDTGLTTGLWRFKWSDVKTSIHFTRMCHVHTNHMFLLSWLTPLERPTSLETNIWLSLLRSKEWGYYFLHISLKISNTNQSRLLTITLYRASSLLNNGATRGWPGVATAPPINLLATPLATPFASPINCNSVSVSPPPPPSDITIASHRIAPPPVGHYDRIAPHPPPPSDTNRIASHPPPPVGHYDRIAPPPVGHFNRPPLNACRPLPGHPTKKSLEAPLLLNCVKRKEVSEHLCLPS